jgi:hypothetical protein
MTPIKKWRTKVDDLFIKMFSVFVILGVIGGAPETLVIVAVILGIYFLCKPPDYSRGRKR